MPPVPDPTTTISSIATYASPYFSAFLPWVALSIGVVIAGIFAAFLIRVFIDSVSKLFNSFGSSSSSASKQLVKENYSVSSFGLRDLD